MKQRFQRVGWWCLWKWARTVRKQNGRQERKCWKLCLPRAIPKKVSESASFIISSLVSPVIPRTLKWKMPCGKPDTATESKSRENRGRKASDFCGNVSKKMKLNHTVGFLVEISDERSSRRSSEERPRDILLGLKGSRGSDGGGCEGFLDGLRVWWLVCLGPPWGLVCWKLRFMLRCLLLSQYWFDSVLFRAVLFCLWCWWLLRLLHLKNKVLRCPKKMRIAKGHCAEVRYVPPSDFLSNQFVLLC